MENTKYKSHSSFMLITVVICLRNEHVHAFVLQRFMHRNTSAPVGFPFFCLWCAHIEGTALIPFYLKPLLLWYFIVWFLHEFQCCRENIVSGIHITQMVCKSNLLETVALQTRYISISLILSHIDSRHCAFALSYLYPITHSRHCVHK